MFKRAFAVLCSLLMIISMAASAHADGGEAAPVVRVGYYDIVLMDIQMPNMDGYEAARWIRKMKDPGKAEIPIVAVTANAFEEDKRIALETGMNGHLAKPYDIPEITQTLISILSKQQDK